MTGRDPRGIAVRIAGPLLLGALFGSLVAARFETALGCMAIAAVTAAWIGSPWPRRAWFVSLATASAIAIVLNAALVGGERLAGTAWSPWPLTREGAALGALLALRVAGAAVALHGLRAAWPGERAADELAGRLAGLERVGLPVRAARAVTGLALRLAPVLTVEADRIVRLQDLRAGRPPRGRAEWLERRRAALVPIVVCGLERAERVAMAMEARHYRMRPIAPPPRAWAAELAGVATVATALVWRA